MIPSQPARIKWQKSQRFFVIIIAGIIGMSISTYSQEAALLYPHAEWEYDLVQEPCIERFVIDSLNTTGLMVIKGGKVIYKYGDIREVSYVAAVRKSILSMLYGIYEARGEIVLSKSLGELGIDDINALTDEEKMATVEEILCSRSGVYLPAANPGSDGNMPERGTYTHGAHYFNNNWDHNVAGTIFEQETGRSLYEAFEEDIAVPIGLQDFDVSEHARSGDTTISIHKAYHFDLSARDMARLGYLMLRKGKWKSDQIIPENWIERSTTKVSDISRTELLRGFGYLWWLYDGRSHSELEGAYTALGAWGQYITIIPKLDIVIAHKTKSIYRRRTRDSEYDQLLVKIINQFGREMNYDLEEYIGTYTIDDDTDELIKNFTIYSENGVLKITSPDFPKIGILDVDFCTTSYSYIGGRIRATFNRDDNGEIKAIRMGDKLFIRSR